MSGAGDNLNLRELVTKRFLTDVLDEAASKTEGWMILVMDDAATRVISSVLTMYDIMEKRVTLVERLGNVRQPYKDMDVIYLISPEMESTNAVIKDFTSESKAKYGDVHLFYLDQLSTPTMNLLQSSSVLVDRIQTLKEINMDFVTSERNVFHFDTPDSLAKMYGKLPDNSHPWKMARQLATLCITIGEQPAIRYQGSSQYAREIGVKLNEHLKEFRESNPSIQFRGDPGSNKERAQILILDRTYDVTTPLMHEYTYQAMANDLLNIEDGVVSIKVETRGGGGAKKQALLNENDELWVEMRHTHIATVIKAITERMKDMMANNAGAALASESGANMSISEMSAALKKLPEYQQTMSNLGQHVSLAQQCMNSFTGDTFALCQLEQTITTGQNEEGGKPRSSEIEAEISEALKTTCLSKLARLRILAILLTSPKGSADSSFVAGLGLTSEEQAVLNSFDQLASTMRSQTRAGKTVFSGMFGGRSKNTRETDDDVPDTRHIHEVKDILSQLCSGDLPKDAFPALGPSAAGKKSEPVAESKRTRKHFGGADNKASVQYKGGRAMVFVAGGLSYAEMRVCNDFEKEQKREVIVGGSHLMSPKKYIKGVAAMHPDSAKIELEEALVSKGAASMQI